MSKDFKLKYRRSVLGVLWSVLNPLLMMCVLAAVFTNVLKFGDVENYPMYLILGNVLFALMSDSTGSAMGSILESAPLIKKIRVSKMLFPIEKVLFTLVNFAISLIAVVIVMIFFRIAPTVDLVLLPLLLAYMLLFCSGLGLLLSALAVFFRDVCHLWGVVITAWTYARPFSIRSRCCRNGCKRQKRSIPCTIMSAISGTSSCMEPPRALEKTSFAWELP